MTVKTAISLKDKLYEYAKQKADTFFQGNFSSYIAYLISKEKEKDAKEESA